MVEILETEASEDRKPRIQSAERTVAVLLTIAISLDATKAKEISDALGLPRQVTYHLLHTLLGTAVLRKNMQNRYVLGLPLLPSPRASDGSSPRRRLGAAGAGSGRGDRRNRLCERLGPR